MRVGRFTIIVVVLELIAAFLPLAAMPAKAVETKTALDARWHTATEPYVGFADPLVAFSPSEILCEENTNMGGACFPVNVPAEYQIAGTVVAQDRFGNAIPFVVSYWNDDPVRATDLRIFCGEGRISHPSFMADISISKIAVSVLDPHFYVYCYGIDLPVPAPDGQITIKYQVIRDHPTGGA